MRAPPAKRSLTLKGHRTSVTLEDEFWRAFCTIAKEKGLSINALAAKIDADRNLETGLASAIRVYVFSHIQAELTAFREP